MVLKIIFVICLISPYFPCSLLCTNVLYVNPSVSGRHIETSWQGAHKRIIASEENNNISPLLQLHPRGNTEHMLESWLQHIGIVLASVR